METRFKLTSYETVAFFNRNVNMKKFLYFHKGNAILAPLEALISFYITAIFIMFTDLFGGYDKDKLPAQTLIISSFSLVLGFIVCFGYTYYSVKKVSKAIYQVMYQVKENITSKECVRLYEKLIYKLEKEQKNIHKWGRRCYTGMGTIVGIIYYYVVNEEMTIEKFLFIVITTTIAGIVFGTLWNYMGYHIDMSVDWTEVIKPLANINKKYKKNIIKDKYAHYKKHFIAHISALLFIITLAFGACVYYINSKAGRDHSWEYYFFISLFITCLILYIKNVFYHFYSKKNSNLYFDLKKIK